VNRATLAPKASGRKTKVATIAIYLPGRIVLAAQQSQRGSNAERHRDSGLHGCSRGHLYEIGPWDPGTYLGTIVVLGSAALPAGLLPAIRAATIAPIILLQQES
jgi:hypothetical protein